MTNFKDSKFRFLFIGMALELIYIFSKGFVIGMMHPSRDHCAEGRLIRVERHMSRDLSIHPFSALERTSAAFYSSRIRSSIVHCTFPYHFIYLFSRTIWLADPKPCTLSFPPETP